MPVHRDVGWATVIPDTTNHKGRASAMQPPSAKRPDRLRSLTEQADLMHRDGMATIHHDLEVAHFDVADADRLASRRQFLTRAGTAALTVGAVSVSLGSLASAAWAQGTMGSTSTTAAAGPGCASGPVSMTASDEQLVIFAESVERAAVAAYGLAQDNPALDPAASESARIFATHHTDHAEALRCLVAGTEQAPNQALVDALAPQITDARSDGAIIEILRQIEAGAAATYLFALGVLETAAVAGAASTILPVEAQHEGVWSQYLGLPVAAYVPAFQTTDGACSPA